MKKKYDRRPGMTQISISLAESIVDEINKIAEMHHRSRSNMIAVILKDYGERHKHNVN